MQIWSIGVVSPTGAFLGAPAWMTPEELAAGWPLIGFILITVALAGTWFHLFGRAPRQRRALRLAHRRLADGDYLAALQAVQIARRLRAVPAAWEAPLRRIEGEASLLAGDDALDSRRFAEALDHYSTAGKLLERDMSEHRAVVLAAMLDQLRPELARLPGNDVTATLESLAKIETLDPRFTEATFWRALALASAGRRDEARDVLLSCAAAGAVDNGVGPIVLDPFLYLGIFFLEAGSPHDALRHLAEANKIASDCPLVPLYMGFAFVRTGAHMLAARTLARAVGPKGLRRFLADPARLWSEGLPSKRSFVQKQAVTAGFACPILGAGLVDLVRQGSIALGQAQYRLGNYEEAVEAFTAALTDGVPSLEAKLGLGMALTRLGRYDQAFRQLRPVYEQENPKSPWSTGFLALCGAKGRPNRPEDKTQNLIWAIKSLRQFDVAGDREWAFVYSATFAEARAVGLAVPLEDQARLCDVLASVEAVDGEAAAAYEQLAATRLEAVQPIHAWLYARSALLHGTSPERGLMLLWIAVSHADEGRAFYAQRQWEFEDVQVKYLELLADAGQLPADFTLPESQAAFLLQRARWHEDMGERAAALATLSTLVRLSPRSPQAHDALARLCWLEGDLERAAAELAECHTLAPDDPIPLARRAVVELKRGNRKLCRVLVERALQFARGDLRVEIALLGARLALLDLTAGSGFRAATFAAADGSSSALALAESYLRECLRLRPDHYAARGCLAALLAVKGARDELAAMASHLDDAEVPHAWYHVATALAFEAANDPARSAQAADRARQAGRFGERDFDSAASFLDAECRLLRARALLASGDEQAAFAEFERTLEAAPLAPSADEARALLAERAYHAGRFDLALHFWNALEPHVRAAWKLDRTLREVSYLAAVSALQGGQYLAAAHQLADLARITSRRGRLAPLLILAQVRAAQDLLEPSPPSEERLAQATALLEAALEAGCHDLRVLLLLARLYQAQSRWLEARNTLHLADRPDPRVPLQLGLLSLAERRRGNLRALPQAEAEFAQAWNLLGDQPDPKLAASIGQNLLACRLSLGRFDQALPQIRAVQPFLATTDGAAWLGHLETLLASHAANNRDGKMILALAAISPDDEARLLQVVRGLGQLELTDALLRTLAAARPNSKPARIAQAEATLLRGKQLLDRFQFPDTLRTLIPLVGERLLPADLHAALLNLVALAACLTNNFDDADHFWNNAVDLQERDARLRQNLALLWEIQGQLARAEGHWDRFFERLDERLPRPPCAATDYADVLAVEGLMRLARRHADARRWPNAINYLLRAHQRRPTAVEPLEQLLQAYNQLQRPDEARAILERLKLLRADTIQLELDELEALPIRTLDDVFPVVERLHAVLHEHGHLPKAAECVARTLNHLIDFFQHAASHLQARVELTAKPASLASTDEVDWRTLRQEVAEHRQQLLVLRQCVERCLGLTVSELPRRQLADLQRLVDSELEICRGLAE